MTLLCQVGLVDQRWFCSIFNRFGILRDEYGKFLKKKTEKQDV